MAYPFFMATRIVLLLSGALCIAHSQAQMTDPGMPPANTVVLTGFAIDKPLQAVDIDDMALGFPKAIARRLAMKNQMSVRTSPELLSFDWQQDTPPVNLLSQLGNLYHSKYVVAGEIRNAGIKIDTNLFGLTQKKTRAIELDIWIYDASSGRLLMQQGFSRTVAGDVLVGREHSFGGVAFASTAYGKIINEMVEQVADIVNATVVAQR